MGLQLSNDEVDAQEIRRLVGTPELVRTAYSEIQSRALEGLEPLLSGARSLVVAHGAAVFATVQLLKGYEGQPLKSISGFAGVFCIGFVLACLSCFFGEYARYLMTQRHWENKGLGYKTDLICTWTFFGLSFVALILATVAVGVKFLKVGLGYD